MQCNYVVPKFGSEFEFVHKLDGVCLNLEKSWMGVSCVCICAVVHLKKTIKNKSHWPLAQINHRMASGLRKKIHIVRPLAHNESN
jgi:hypothetical protein